MTWEATWFAGALDAALEKLEGKVSQADLMRAVRVPVKGRPGKTKQPSDSYISRLRTGESKPSEETMAQIAREIAKHDRELSGAIREGYARDKAPAYLWEEVVWLRDRVKGMPVRVVTDDRLRPLAERVEKLGGYTGILKAMLDATLYHAEEMLATTRENLKRFHAPAEPTAPPFKSTGTEGNGP
jgi:transcriptional regulator with XRE-family HTH domain